jgi:hypothetical protein
LRRETQPFPAAPEARASALGSARNTPRSVVNPFTSRVERSQTCGSDKRFARCFRLIVKFERQPKKGKPKHFGQGSKTTANLELR